jgi:hypothetical protein
MWSEVPLRDELRAELGEPRRVQRLRSSPRSRVWLVERADAPVVVKQLVEGPMQLIDSAVSWLRCDLPPGPTRPSCLACWLAMLIETC